MKIAPHFAQLKSPLGTYLCTVFLFEYGLTKYGSTCIYYRDDMVSSHYNWKSSPSLI